MKLNLCFLMLLLLGGLFNYSKVEAQDYAPYPFYECFDSTWIIEGGNSVPSSYWKANNHTAQNYWNRSDFTGWGFPLDGIFNPPGACNTPYSARIHTSRTDLVGTLDLYIDLSSYTGIKYLTFWYINKYSYINKDSLKVFFSSNGGVSFGDALFNQQSTNDWTKIIVDLGNSNTPTGVIRFWTVGDWGGSDIGIDEVKVTGIVTDFSTNMKIGVAPFTVNFIDNSLGNADNWQWDFDNDGIIDATTQNPSYTYNTAGEFDVKLIIIKDSEKDTIIKEKYIKVNSITGIDETENFSPVELFPNPASDFVNIRIKNTDEISQIDIYNIFGQLVRSQRYLNSNEIISLDINGLSTGIYYINTTNKNITYTNVLIIN